MTETAHMQVEAHRVTVVVSDAGSGAAAAAQPWLRTAGWARDGYQLALCEPRPAAAAVAAGTLAAQIGGSVGTTVGWRAAFQDVHTPVRFTALALLFFARPARLWAL